MDLFDNLQTTKHRDLFDKQFVNTWATMMIMMSQLLTSSVMRMVLVVIISYDAMNFKQNIMTDEYD